MNELATAYVQIIPSAEGIQGSLTKLFGGESEEAGKNSGESFISKAGSAIKSGAAAVGKVALAGLGAAATGVGALVTQAISAYADFEQLTGGVETLYGSAASTVESYAANAYKTAGMSANSYMETATSFAASLVSSLGGDTAAAAELANTAITDMSDNANKMGTDMESIQNAYNGFAKQNYTMLDNLKLGYGGTKEEMQRLLDDATALSGVEYDISSYSDIVSAIHVVQDNLGITGTTAREASETISGSIDTMKGAWTNLIAGMADENADFDSLVSNLVDSVLTVADNVMPRITQALSGVGKLVAGLAPVLGEYIVPMIQELLPSVIEAVTGLFMAIVSALPDLLTTIIEAIPTLVTTLIDGIVETAPQFIESGRSLLSSLGSGLLEGLPDAITSVGSVVNGILNYILQNAPQLMTQGFNLITNLASGIMNNLPAVVSSIASVIAQLLATIAQNLPSILQSGLTLLGKFLAGIIQGIPQIPGKVMQIINSIKSTFGNYNWASLGKSIIDGIVNGIKNFGSSIVTAIVSQCSGAFQAVKNFFGIASPSKKMKNEIGRWIPLGMAAGINAESGSVTKAMQALSEEASGSVNVTTSVKGSGTSTMADIVQRLDDLTTAFNQMQIVLPVRNVDAVMGRDYSKKVVGLA